MRRTTWLHRRFSIAQPLRFADNDSQGFCCGRDLQCVLVRVHAFGKLDAEAFNASLHQQLGHLGRTAFACLVAVVGNQHPLCTVCFECGQHVIGEAFNAIGAGDVAIPRTPERQRINQRFAQDDFLVRLQCPHVEYATPAPFARGQVQVLGCACAQVVQELAAIHFNDVALLVQHRHDQRTVEMLVAGFAVDADFL